jgi:hypothetical protein
MTNNDGMRLALNRIPYKKGNNHIGKSQRAESLPGKADDGARRFESKLDQPARAPAQWLSSRFLPMHLRYRFNVDYERNRITTWKAVSGPLPLTFRRTFEPVEGGTRVTIRYEAEPRGFLQLVGPLVARMGKRQLEGDFPKLKELMEARAL